ncbi:MAG: ferrous iron transport protein B [Armatimonadetes bacterium]|nr:ferrous iron transport protein B [Armatimonadota bacterium]
MSNRDSALRDGADAVRTPPRRIRLALVGNPNCGKTTLFNALTGMRQKVGNYPGITVEHKEGILRLPGGETVTLIDLPGLYSLTPQSPDEQVARDVLLGYRADTPRPDLVLNVVDASSLERNLYLTSQLMDVGLPVLIALTMNDTAGDIGVRVAPEALSQSLGGVPVVAVNATRNAGIADLVGAIGASDTVAAPPVRRWTLPPLAEREVAEMAHLLETVDDVPRAAAFSEATLLLSLPDGSAAQTDALRRHSPTIREHLAQDLANFHADNIDLSQAIAEARYADVGRVVYQSVHRNAQTPPLTLSDKIDRVVLHRVWGYVLFLGVMGLLFQAMFTWASIPADAISAGVDWLGQTVSAAMPPGDLRDLIVNGAIAGVGNTVVFLPQILLLFLFIGFLEDTGYLARAAFLMDRLMSRVGLHGKSFIPLLSSYACAIPGVMAARTIESSRARILTILVAPLMSCSARIPVYAVLIGAFIPATSAFGFTVAGRTWGPSWQAVTLFSMYALGTVAAFGVAALFNRTILKSDAPTFLLEMPPYRLPSVRSVVLRMLENAWTFVSRAGTVILALSVVLWFLSSYPKRSVDTPPSEVLRQSYAGTLGRAIEPVIAPLGFDWKIGIGLVASFTAREVFVTAMGTVYAVSEDVAADEEKQSVAVGEKMKADINPRTGRPTFTPLVAVSLMVYYVLAMQCISTVAVVKRETNGWKWPLIQIAYMTALAWLASFIVYQGGRFLGFG